MDINNFEYKVNNGKYIITGLKNKSLKNVIIPEGVIEIGKSAFFNENIETIHFPSSLTIINNDAFRFCKNLKSISFHPNCKLNTIDTGAFSYCKELLKVNLPEHVERIGVLSFSNCEKLTEIFIPVDVIKIGGLAFKGANKDLLIKLEKTKVPSTFSSSWNADNHKVKLLLNDIAIKPLSKSTSTINTNKTVTINTKTSSENIKKIDTSTIKATNKTTNTISINNNNFIEKTNKEETINLDEFIIIPSFNNGKELVGYKDKNNSSKVLIIPKCITTIGKDAFRCGKIKTLIGHDKLNSIQTRAFSGSQINEIKLNKNTSIGDYAFANSCLKVAYVNDYTFEGAYSGSQVKKIVFYDDVTSIKEKTFYSCSKLEEVLLPNNLTSIDMKAFAHCYNIKKVKFNNNLKTIEQQAFDGCRGIIELIFPNSLTTIGNLAFNLCEGLKRIVINPTLKHIKSSAFSGCSSLEVVRIPRSVYKIDRYAFGSYNLKEIIIEKKYSDPETIPTSWDQNFINYNYVKDKKVKITFVNVW